MQPDYVTIVFRVVPRNVQKIIENNSFTGYGSHTNEYHCPYLTVAIAIGMTKSECEIFLKRFDKVLCTIKKKSERKIKDTDKND